MKNRLCVPLACTALLCAFAGTVSATHTSLAMRSGNVMRIHGGFTTQTISTAFGTNLETLAFSGTTNYDFYTPPASVDVSLFIADKGGGVIYMRNTSATSANDFSVSGRMQYFDYDPATGAETLIVDTTASGAKNVNHNQTVNWAIPNALLPANTVIPAGHMIHIKMTITLISGNPGSFGQVLYGGPEGSCTRGYLPQNRSAVLDWPLDSSALIGCSPPEILSCCSKLDKCMELMTVGIANSSYSIEATTDLAAPVWVTLGTNITDANGLFSFIDQDSTNYPSRFYRAVAR